MVFVRLDPDLLQTTIDTLTSYADLLATERQATSTTNRSVDDPAAISMKVSEYSVLAGYDLDLAEKADELQTRLNEAIVMNSSGIIMTDEQGRIGYYLPDSGAYSEDTVENVVLFNSQSSVNGTFAAQALSEAMASPDGTASDGRTAEEILAEMANHQDVPAYAAGFIQSFGIFETFSSLPDQTRAAHLIAAASQGWGTEMAAGMANAVASGYEELPDTLGPLERFNSIMSTTDLTFGHHFLVELADAMDDADVYHATVSPGSRTGPLSFPDPLSGISTAMLSTPDAALEYLVRDPEAPEEETMTRINEILSRHPAGANGWTDTWSQLLAHASGYSLETVDSAHPPSEDAHRAALAASAGVSWLAGAKDMSQSAREHVSTMLANTAWSVDEAARREERAPESHAEPNPSEAGAEGEDPGDPTVASLTTQPQYDRRDLAAVLGVLSDAADQEPFNRVGHSVGALSANRLAHATHQASQGDSSYLQAAMNNHSASQGYLISAAQAAIEADAADADKRSKAVIDMVMGATTFIPGVGEAGEFVSNAFDYSKARAASLGTEALNQTYAGNLAAAIQAGRDQKGEQSEVLQASLLITLAQGGALDAPILDGSGNDTGQTQLERLQARLPDLFVDGQIDPGRLDGAMIEELNDIIDNPGPILSTDQQTWLDLSEDAYTDGYNNARAS